MPLLIGTVCVCRTGKEQHVQSSFCSSGVSFSTSSVCTIRNILTLRSLTQPPSSLELRTACNKEEEPTALKAVHTVRKTFLSLTLPFVDAGEIRHYFVSENHGGDLRYIEMLSHLCAFFSILVIKNDHSLPIVLRILHFSQVV